jgi:DUF4097 and DUF4098 domain-containing protein YvlB
MRKIPILVVTAALVVPAAASAQSASAGRAHPAAGAHAVQQPPPQPPRPPRPSVDRNQDGREEQRETFTKTVRVGANGILDISNLSGNIDVRRGGGSDVVIEVTKVARARTADAARELLPMVNPEINSRGERVEIRTIYGGGQPMRGRNFNVSVHYNITAPSGTRIRAVTLSGNVTASDIQGELSLTTTSGDVKIANASRVTAARSTSGDVHLTNIDSDVALDASTVSGDVIVRSAKARRMTLGTVSGEVIVHDVQTERLGAKSFTGDVEFSGTLAKGGRYEFTSHSGHVRVSVGGGSGFEVEANSWSGSVRSDFSLGGSDDHNKPARGPRKVLRGVVGDGSAVINITTFSGNVHLVKR